MDQQNTSLFDLQIDQQSISYLAEGAKWARFIAIIGFVFCGLMVLAAFSVGAIMSMMSNTMGDVNGMSAMGTGFFTFFYLVFAAIGVIPCLYLYRFGSRMQEAIRENQQEVLNTSFNNLKRYFKFIGILCIVVLAMYAVAIIGAIIFSVFAMR